MLKHKSFPKVLLKMYVGVLIYVDLIVSQRFASISKNSLVVNNNIPELLRKRVNEQTIIVSFLKGFTLS